MKAFERKLVELKEENFVDGVLNPAICAEYLTDQGMFNIRYLERVLDTKLYDTEVHLFVMNLFGQNIFDIDHVTNQVSEEEFLEHYEFGKYLSVIQWVGYFREAHKKVLTKEALFSYILVDKSL